MYNSDICDVPTVTLRWYCIPSPFGFLASTGVIGIFVMYK